MNLLRAICVYAICGTLVLSGCVTNGARSTGAGIKVGPQLSSFFDPTRKAEIDHSKPKLDVVVPVFDPGLSEDAANYEEEGVWPELRRAEANRFAYKLKTALEDTEAFGAVRVTPDSTATGDLYVLGRIIESDGEDVEIELEVVDIAGRHWFTRYFDHSVDSGFHKNARNKGKDPYDPMFEEAANRVALELEDYTAEQLVEIERTADLRFGANFSEDAFSEHFEVDDGEFSLLSYPSEDDPMLDRTQAIRVREQLFVDGLQDSYRSFSEEMEDSYLIWQEQSLLEMEAKRDAEMKAAGQAVVGVLAIGLAVAAIAAGADADSMGDTAALSGGIVAGAAGAHMLQQSFQTSEEAKIHREALEELGESIDVDLAPRVIEFEEETVELTGDAKEQFSQWREFIQKIYEQERTPEVQL